MAATASPVHFSGMGFSGKCLRYTVCFEADRACRNIFGRRLRFGHFLPPKILTLCFQSKHNFPDNLEGVDGYEKESVLMGYKALDDLIANESFHEKFLENLKGDNYRFDPTLVHKQFPSITVGYFPTVELYDGAPCSSDTKESEVPQIPEGFSPSCVDANWVGPNCVAQAPSSLYEEILNINAPYSLEENFDESTLYSQSPYSKAETRNGLQLTTEEPCSSAGSEAQQATLSVSQILDKHISCVPGLNKRQLSQLEKCGFHTLRKLLHHFPRTYADLQNAEVEIDDGQYFIFVGQVISSRGIRASYSFAFLEVVVACEVAGVEPNSQSMDAEVENSTKRTVYLHLKKFFRGTRFTCPPFLRSLQDKHREGDMVCVSGKVRSGNSKDHFEMREYNIDVLKDEGDSSVYTKGRPYPIYPSKKGLNPEYLRDIISRHDLS